MTLLHYPSLILLLTNTLKCDPVSKTCLSLRAQRFLLLTTPSQFLILDLESGQNWRFDCYKGGSSSHFVSSRCRAAQHTKSITYLSNLCPIPNPRSRMALRRTISGKRLWARLPPCKVMPLGPSSPPSSTLVLLLTPPATPEQCGSSSQHCS